MSNTPILLTILNQDCPTRARNVLLNMNAETWEQVAAMPDKQLRQVHGCGRLVFKQIRALQEKHLPPAAPAPADTKDTPACPTTSASA